MRPVQRFPDAYLAGCREMTHEEIARFLEDFRLLHGGGRPGPARPISLRVPDDLLTAFKAKAARLNIRYQTQIKNLMRAWLDRAD